MLCSKCGEENWKLEKEQIITKSQKWPIELENEIKRFECLGCGDVWYSADLDTESMYPVELK